MHTFYELLLNIVSTNDIQNITEWLCFVIYFYSHTFNFLQLGLVRPGTAHVAGQVMDHYQLNCLLQFYLGFSVAFVGRDSKYLLKLTVGDGQYHHTMPLFQLHTLRKIENTSQVVNRNQMTDYIGKFEDVDNVVTEGDNGFMLAKLQDI
ncbi:hypothetical protein M8C21_016562, partial [Ambrosia artemisiifolia]